ncbi:hypothetical protein C7E18_11665 [Stenotrophomonas maltophilia]|nr:hypothetical protein C7E18_11665 [Stenotrophomonas maltophilia]
MKNGQACQRHAPASSPAAGPIATDATNCALHHERRDLALVVSPCPRSAGSVFSFRPGQACCSEAMRESVMTVQRGA